MPDTKQKRKPMMIYLPPEIALKVKNLASETYKSQSQFIVDSLAGTIREYEKK